MLRECMTITKALSDENRVRTLMFLRQGELCVCQIIEMLRLAPSTVSKHLAILRQAGLIDSSKKGRWVYYKLAAEDASPAVAGVLDWLQASLNRDPRILHDSQHLKEVRKKNMEDLCMAYMNANENAA